MNAHQKRIKLLVIFTFLIGSILAISINVSLGLLTISIITLVGYGVALLKTSAEEGKPKVKIKASKSIRKTISRPTRDSSTPPLEDSRSREQKGTNHQKEYDKGNSSSESKLGCKTSTIPISENNKTTESKRREEAKQKESNSQMPGRRQLQSEYTQSPSTVDPVSVGEQVHGSSGFKIPKPSNTYISTTWIPYGRATQIQDLMIPGGLIYVRDQASSLAAQPQCNELAVIDTSKQIASRCENSENKMEYWSGYSQITPADRRTYLNWLANGRRDLETNIGCVFLFFYGLEHRVFLDKDFGEVAEHESKIIASEVERLLALYGEDSNSFCRYASAFLEWISFRTIPTKLYEKSLPPLRRSYTLPLHIRIALGQTAVDQVRVPPHLALAWANLDENISRGTPTRRCQKEFAKVFLAKYEEMTEGGILIPRTKTKLEVEYIPASSEIRGYANLKRSFGDLPDVSVLSRPTKKLQEVVNAATIPLEEFSRFIGKNPQAKDSLEGLLKLPLFLWPKRAKHSLLSLKENLGDEHKTMRLWDVAERISQGISGNEISLSREGILCLIQILRSLDIGIEPNVLGGAKMPKSKDPVILFSILASEDEKTINEEYAIRALTLQLASAYAQKATDGFTDNQIHYLEKVILEWPDLTPDQNRRLQAHLKLLSIKGITLRSLKNKFQHHSKEVREDIASCIISISSIDKVPTTSEIQALEMVYQVLGLDSTRVYSGQNREVSKSNLRTQEAKGGEESGIILDEGRIKEIMENDKKLNASLQDLFNNSDEAISASSLEAKNRSDAGGDHVTHAEITSGESGHLLGLDEANSSLAERMLVRNEWPREELQALANDLGLMVDGAIEHINDAAYELYQLPFCEGDDPVVLNSELTSRLTE